MRYIGDFQSRMLLTLFYFTIVVPFALIVRICTDPLRVRSRRRSGWVSRRPDLTDLKSFQQQF